MMNCLAMVVASQRALHIVEPGYKVHDHGLRFSRLIFDGCWKI